MHKSVRSTPATPATTGPNTLLSSLVTFTFEDILTWAQYAPLIPLKKHSKYPMKGFKWRKKPECRPTQDPEQLARWYETYRNHNWGLFGNPDKLAIVDVDTKDGKNGLAHAMEYIYPGRELSEWANLMGRSPSGGFHIYHTGLGYNGLNANSIKVSEKKLDIDVRGNRNGLALLLGSVIKREDGTFGRYSFIGEHLSGEALRAALKELTTPPKILVSLAAETISVGEKTRRKWVQNLLTTATATATAFGYSATPPATATATATATDAVTTLILKPTLNELESLRVTNPYFRKIWWKGHEVGMGRMSEVIFTIVKVSAFGRLPLPKIQGVVREVFDRFEHLGIRYTPKVIGQVERTYAKVCETYAPPAPKGVAAHHYIEHFCRLHGRLPKPRELADFAGIDKNTAKTALKRFLKKPPQSEAQTQIENHDSKEYHPMNNKPTLTRTFPLLWRTFDSLKLNHHPTPAQVDEMMAESPWRFRADGDEQAAKAISKYAEYVRETRKTVPQSYKWYRNKLTTVAYKDIEFLEATTPRPIADEAREQDMPDWVTNDNQVPEAGETVLAPVLADSNPPLEAAVRVDDSEDEILARIFDAYEARKAA